MLYQHAELGPVLQCECIVSLNNKVDAILHCTTGPSTTFSYNKSIVSRIDGIN